MNKTIFGIFMFAIGAGIGSIATWKFVETKYKKIADEEIESVKRVFSRREEKTNTYESTDSDDEDELDIDIHTVYTKPEKVEYSKISSKYKSSNYTKPEKEKEGESMKSPYVIPPEEFGETDYSTESLIYYADKVLTDDMNNLIDDVDGLIGSESLNHFGEYEDDSVFVRNDDLATDFEILLDVRNYSDVVPDYECPVSDE